MSKVLCFGELLLRLSPQLGGEWIRQNLMPVFIGGAELNVATALAKWGIPVSYSTVLPDNYLATEIIDAVHQRGIETDKILMSGERIGTYYLPQGADMKAAGVLYDRAYSSFWELRPGQIDWEAVLQDVSWFHFSAISPALNKNVAAVCMEGVAAASKKGLTVSVDLNYRTKLWQWGKASGDVMPEFVAHCDLVMGNIWAAEKMLGIAFSESSSNEKNAFLDQARKTSESILQRFSKCKSVANTFRFTKGDGVQYYATLFQNDAFYVAPEHRTTCVIDNVGSGDAFMAGLIYGVYDNLRSQDMIDFATAAAFNKLFIRGDATTATVEEIKKGASRYA